MRRAKVGGIGRESGGGVLSFQTYRSGFAAVSRREELQTSTQETQKQASVLSPVRLVLKTA